MTRLWINATSCTKIVAVRPNGPLVPFPVMGPHFQSLTICAPLSAFCILYWRHAIWPRYAPHFCVLYWRHAIWPRYAPHFCVLYWRHAIRPRYGPHICLSRVTTTAGGSREAPGGKGFYGRSLLLTFNKLHKYSIKITIGAFYSIPCHSIFTSVRKYPRKLSSCFFYDELLKYTVFISLNNFFFILTLHITQCFPKCMEYIYLFICHRKSNRW